MTSDNIWETCNGKEKISPLSGVLYRLVESQDQNSDTEVSRHS